MFCNSVAWNDVIFNAVVLFIMPPPLIGGGIKWWCCLTSVWRLASVCLTSVAYIGPKSRTERPRKTNIGTEVTHFTCDSDTTFKMKRVKGQGHRGRGHIVAAYPHSLFKRVTNWRTVTKIRPNFVQIYHKFFRLAEICETTGFLTSQQTVQAAAHETKQPTINCIMYINQNKYRAPSRPTLQLNSIMLTIKTMFVQARVCVCV